METHSVVYSSNCWISTVGILPYPVANAHRSVICFNYVLLVFPNPKWYLPSISSKDIQNFISCVNDVSDGSPSRIRIVRRISFGITTRPRSSIRLTIPVAFILLPPQIIFWLCEVSISALFLIMRTFMLLTLLLYKTKKPNKRKYPYDTYYIRGRLLLLTWISHLQQSWQKEGSGLQEGVKLAQKCVKRRKRCIWKQAPKCDNLCHSKRQEEFET